MKQADPIGVFDSGVGGLTVLKALRAALPHEDFIYLGDTARLPYGTKSQDTVAHYALQAAGFFLEEKIKLLVVACNTASALALPSLRETLPRLPCLDVIEPGARAAATTSLTGRIVVLATESTVQSGAYEAAIRRYRPNASIAMLACNLLVAMAEEGWCDGNEAESIAERYLHQLAPDYDTLVLGCTHFPLLSSVIQKLIGPNIIMIDSAATTAQAALNFLGDTDLLNSSSEPGECQFYVTESPERFRRIARRFLEVADLPPPTLVTLGPAPQNEVSLRRKSANIP